MSKSIQTHVVGSTAKTNVHLNEAQVWNTDLRSIFGKSYLKDGKITIIAGDQSLTVSFVAANASKLSVACIEATDIREPRTYDESVSDQDISTYELQGFLNRNKGEVSRDDVERVERLQSLLNPRA